MKQSTLTPLERAKSGNGASLANQLGISRSAVSQWTRVPVERVLDVERITGVSRHQLRPDIYPDSEANA
jgi:DNA-binding transcriptional regulator YdaS (Cro superfamily)